MDDLNSSNQDSTVRANKPDLEELLNIFDGDGFELFHDQNQEAYIAFLDKGTRVIKLSSKEFKNWISNYSWTYLQYALPTETLNKVIQILSGKACYHGEEHILAVRHFMDNLGLWYDCGDGSAIHITPDGWRLTNRVPIMFRRFSHQKPQVWPIKEGSLDLLSRYINLKNKDDLLLFYVYIVAAFIPDIPHPLLILHGPQGAGKTTPMRVMKAIIDPSTIQSLPPPSDLQSFAQIASHHSCFFFDNLTHLPQWLSDALARVSTGDGFSKRALYTDDEDIIYTLQKTVALNGITQVVTKPDLLDRSILLSLKRISPKKRKSEQDFWAQFEEDRPAILGSIYEILSNAMAIYPTVELKELPRMADFAKWGYAIAEAAGFTGQRFIDAYTANIKIQNDEAIEANPVAQALLALSEESGSWQGTAAQLLLELNEYASVLQLDKSYGWPKDAARLGKIITQILPNLEAKGVVLKKENVKNERMIYISKSTESTVSTVLNEAGNSIDPVAAQAVKTVFGEVKNVENPEIVFGEE